MMLLLPLRYVAFIILLIAAAYATLPYEYDALYPPAFREHCRYITLRYATVSPLATIDDYFFSHTLSLATVSSIFDILHYFSYASLPAIVSLITPFRLPLSVIDDYCHTPLFHFATLMPVYMPLFRRFLSLYYFTLRH